MALSVVDVLSWPWAKAYTTFSVCLLTRCIYNLYEEAKDPLIQTALVNKLSQNSPDGRTGDDNVNNEELHSTVLWYQATDSFCIWVSGPSPNKTRIVYGSVNDIIFYSYIKTCNKTCKTVLNFYDERFPFLSLK